MTGYNLDKTCISLQLADTPVGYTPPIGLAVKFTANYDHRESADMTNISNLGNKWSFGWLSYIQAPSTSNVVSYGPGGGQLSYKGFTSSGSGGGSFSPQQLTQNLYS
jgi:hypothetical protein